MVKIKGPMLSPTASGTIGQAATFSSWKGRAYARKKSKPADPHAPLQIAARAMFQFLTQAWPNLPQPHRDTWNAAALAADITAISAYCRHNLQLWGQFKAPYQFIHTPPFHIANSGTLDSATGGPNRITLAFTTTSIVNIWGVTLFRSAVPAFTPSLTNCIGVIPTPLNKTYSYQDTPPAPGTWYYNARWFGLYGTLEPIETERSATST